MRRSTYFWAALLLVGLVGCEQEGTGELGEACSADGECVSGICAIQAGFEEGQCSRECEGACDAPGFSCVSGYCYREPDTRDDRDVGILPPGPDPEDPNPEDPNPEDPNPEDPNPEDPDPEDPNPEDPNPEEPDPEDPNPEDPDPEDPDPEDPDPEDPDPEDPNPEDPDPEPGQLDCPGILECLQACEDEACANGCFEQGSAAGRQALEALLTCAEANGCQDNACVERACGAELNACFGGGPDPDPQPDPDPDPEPGQLSCAGIVECFQPCEDQACADACFEQGSAEGQRQLEALLVCADENGCEDNACVERLCGDELNACFGGVEPEPDPDPQPDPDPGQLTCEEVFTCFEGCFDEACLDACIADGSPEAQRQVDALFTCAEQNACADFNCVERECRGEVVVCFGEAPGPGPEPDPGEDLSCPEVFDCFATCEDEVCANACIGAATPEGQAQVEAIFTCAEENRCEDGACVEANCPAEVDACFGDAPPEPDPDPQPDPDPAGTTCVELFDCFGLCAAGDQACLAGCFEAASAEAQGQYVAIAECAEANACEDGACVEAQCAPEIEACFGPPPAPGADGCGMVLGCALECETRQCVRDCYAAGDAEAQGLYDAVAECAADSLCDSIEACVAACPAQFEACEAD